MVNKKQHQMIKAFISWTRLLQAIIFWKVRVLTMFLTLSTSTFSQIADKYQI